MGPTAMSVDAAIFSTMGFGILMAMLILSVFLWSISKKNRAQTQRRHAHQKTGIHSHSHNKI